MLAIFCARVALGLVACLLLLSPRQLHPRYFRSQFLTALGTLVIATMFGWQDSGPWPRGLLVGGTVLSLLGALSWTLDPAPGGRTLILLSSIALIAGLVFLEPLFRPSPSASDGFDPRWCSGSGMPVFVWAIAGYTSALLLGAFLTAMLVGHSYLISPGMSLAPLMRCLAAGGLALTIRAVLIGWTLSRWITLQGGLHNIDNEMLLELPVRWLVGIVAPFGFGWMAYSAARIRSTQSATGILYVVVVCGFLGELLGLLLTRQTGMPL